MDELTARIGRYVGEPVSASALSGPLRQLKERQYGRILADVTRPAGDARVFKSHVVHRSPDESVHSDAPRGAGSRTRPRIRIAGPAADTVNTRSSSCSSIALGFGHPT